MKRDDFPDIILTVHFFVKENGSEPVREWLKSLPYNYKKVIGEDIKTVQYGWPLGMPLVRKLDKALWEVISNLKDGISRVLFTVKDDCMILLHGFIKKSNKIPKEELQVALKRRNMVL